MRSPSAGRSDRETLAPLGAPGVDDGAATARLHANEKAVRARAADLGGLVGAFHVGFLEPACVEGKKALTAEYGARSGNRRLQQEEPAPSTRKVIVAPRRRVPAPPCIPLWITSVSAPRSITMRCFPGPLLHTCDPTSGNAAANAWRPSCPTSNSTPGSGPFPTPTSPRAAT